MGGNQSFKYEVKKYAPDRGKKNTAPTKGRPTQGQRIPLRTTTQTQTRSYPCLDTGMHAYGV
eukprot:7544874-Pyramimonas_sp.AAC.1